MSKAWVVAPGATSTALVTFVSADPTVNGAPKPTWVGAEVMVGRAPLNR